MEHVEHKMGMKRSPAGRLMVNCSCGWSATTPVDATDMHGEALHERHLREVRQAWQWDLNANATDERDRLEAEWLTQHIGD